MKYVYIISVTSVIFVLCFSTIQARGINGGMSCAVCTVLMGVAMQVAEIHEESMVDAAKKIVRLLAKVCSK
ncbi:hypothetical protein NQ317_019385 [Molorchus minor]|uniref:Uncharacterized protein n=1 Tax=Molorchus minor TaxID=1323400 RepID=A0ABQ9JD59_9CUCU|nr:hypothetical protein NQ317_019385 [Molorchus minor]